MQVFCGNWNDLIYPKVLPSRCHILYSLSERKLVCWFRPHSSPYDWVV